MEHRNISGFELCNFVADESPNAFAAIFTPAEGDQFMLSMPVVIAGQIAARLSEALMQIEREGKRVRVHATPERIMGYTAAHVSTDDGEAVVVRLDGDRSNPFVGALTPTDARRLAALLTAAAASADGTPAKTH